METGLVFDTFVLLIILSIIVFAGLLITIAFLTLLERKFIGSTQNRKGPNVVGPFGILQPFADALKLIIKEAIFPRNARLAVFILAPLVSLFFALIAWAFIPFSYFAVLVDVNIGLFYIFASSILHVYGVILAGWASGSRFSFLGALRSTAQLVSYDITIGVVICTISLFTKSLNLLDIVSLQDQLGYFALYLPGILLIFLIASLAETNRHPFDLPEAESELVGGYTTEYAAAFFAFFFLGEYCSILLMVFLINHLFFGGWTAVDSSLLSFGLYLIKLLALYYFFLIIRAAIPRYRYDQLMRLGWKFILPASLAIFASITLILLGSDLIAQLTQPSAIMLHVPINSEFADHPYYTTMDWSGPLDFYMRIIHPNLDYSLVDYKSELAKGRKVQWMMLEAYVKMWELVGPELPPDLDLWDIPDYPGKPKF